MAITVTPIGPVLVYGWLVPIIDPLIPKPEGVPAHAEAEYQWKGFGLVWIWEDSVEAGCARWMAAEGYGGPVRTISVFAGNNDCDVGLKTMGRMSFMDTSTYGSEPNDWPYQECPFTLSEETIRLYRSQIQELSDINRGELETNLLAAMRSELDQIDGMNLRAQQFGCRTGQS
ncbi:MAG: hypothetical protein JY451_05455 [Erythrobacter sp.]|nr:MAG: hypothetical protein JY451_05455 [Erythrobacter sp.]